MLFSSSKSLRKRRSFLFFFFISYACKILKPSLPHITIIISIFIRQSRSLGSLPLGWDSSLLVDTSNSFSPSHIPCIHVLSSCLHNDTTHLSLSLSHTQTLGLPSHISHFPSVHSGRGRCPCRQSPARFPPPTQLLILLCIEGFSVMGLSKILSFFSLFYFTLCLYC